MKKLLIVLTFMITPFVIADPRIQYVRYGVNDVVLIHSAVGVATQIVFGKDEEIREMASGFSDGWEIVDKRNNVYLKPKVENAATNLIITTNKRNYAFDLKLTSKAKSTYRIVFSYPNEELMKSDKEFEKALIQNSLAISIASSISDAKNINYTMQSNKFAEEITPIEAFDDGRFTYIKFPKNSEMPVVYKIGEDKAETIVNTHIQNGYLVVHGIFKTLALRAGNAVVGLYNESYNTVSGDDSTSGTISESVDRVIKK